jgi:hypothetical protein
MSFLTGRKQCPSGHWCAALCLLILVFAGSLRAQSNPSVSFTLDFPGSQPEHYTIRVAADGKATYESRGPLNSTSEATDDFHINFEASPPTRERIFALTDKAHRFSGDLESHRKNLASTGNKTLTYDDGSKPVSASFNYSNQVPVQELTRLFQDMSSTLEFARRLNFYYRYQKLALDAELKRMEELAKGNGLAELQAAEPILRQIADDPSVINVVRARAKGLTERIAR